MSYCDAKDAQECKEGRIMPRMLRKAWQWDETKSEVPGGAADGYVFSWEGVATKAAITRRLSRLYHHLDPEVVPRRSSEASSLSVKYFNPPTHFLVIFLNKKIKNMILDIHMK